MKVDSSNVLTVLTTTISAIIATIQDNIVYQIIVSVLGVLGLILNIAYTIWKWYRKASSDGKITPDEVDELVDSLYEDIKGGKDNE